MNGYRGSNAWYVGAHTEPDALSTGGGGRLPENWRSILDARRAGVGRTPDAEYPDGYLGTVPSRRGDRLLAGIKVKLTDRPYTRGVHRGSRIDPGDYEWPGNFNMATGLEHQARGEKWAPQGTPEERSQVNNSKYSVATPEEIADSGRDARFAVGQYTSNRLRDLIPTWRSG